MTEEIKEVEVNKSKMWPLVAGIIVGILGAFFIVRALT